ncbi:MAG: T9SS type A sorting domain-containing protein [Bacteroidetes bacterium]|nr:MAG: T9SS type A sorting domain-containing protein [Bacteroidota bacterium]
MKNAAKFFLKMLAFLLIGGFASGQSLMVIRTDVTANRSGFVTATYTFGIDIIADGVENCNGVTFELSYDSYDYIKYSQWQHGAFGPKTTTAVISEDDNPLHQGKVYVGATSGEDIGNASIDNPKVIHLDFVVTPNAPNRGKVTLSFTNAMAVINDSSSGGKIINLQSQPVVFDIHGFVFVYPGDTDNNGIVDNRDFAYIDLYMGYGTEAIPVRSFKRENPSTLWEPQRCLLWDDSQATYADCDGNGEVTVTDVLVWKYNFLKTHSIAVKTKDHTQASDLRNSDFIKTENSISIPVYINSANDFLGVSGKLNIENSSEYKILGIDKGDLLNSHSAFIFTKFDENCSTIDFAIGSLDDEIQTQKTGIIAYLIVEALNKNSEKNVNVVSNNMTGISIDGMLFGIESSVNYVNENLQNVDKIVQSNNSNVLSIFSENLKYGYIEPILFDILGNKINCNYLHENEKLIVDISQLNSGIYFVELNVNKSFIYLKIIK